MLLKSAFTDDEIDLLFIAVLFLIGLFMYFKSGFKLSVYSNQLPFLYVRVSIREERSQKLTLVIPLLLLLAPPRLVMPQLFRLARARPALLPMKLCRVRHLLFCLSSIAFFCISLQSWQLLLQMACWLMDVLLYASYFDP